MDKKIKDSGLRLDYIADNLGISRACLYKKLKAIAPFRLPEVFYICNLLSIDEDDRHKFFCSKEQLKS